MRAILSAVLCLAVLSLSATAPAAEKPAKEADTAPLGPEYAEILDELAKLSDEEERNARRGATQKVEQSEARVKDAEAALKSAQQEADQMEANLRIAQSWLGGQTEEVIRLIQAGSKGVAVPRQLRSVTLRSPAGEALELGDLRGSSLLLGAYATNDPSLRNFAGALTQLKAKFQSEYGVQPVLVLLDASDATLRSKVAELHVDFPIYSGRGPDVRAAFEHGPVYSGTYIFLDKQGVVRHQGPLPLDQQFQALLVKQQLTDLKQEQADNQARVGQLKRQVAATQAARSVNVADACIDGFHKFDLKNHGSTTPDMDADNRVFCICVAANLRHVLTPEERVTFAADPVAFVRKAEDERSADGKPIWRLYTPVASCTR